MTARPAGPADAGGGTSAGRARSGRRRKAAREALSTYLGAVGRIPRIDAAAEARLSGEIHAARREVARLALGLDDDLRRRLRVPGDPDDPRRWQAREAMAFCDRVAQLHRRRPATVSPDLRREARRSMRRLRQAREALTAANLRLVVHIAKRYRSSTMSVMDLVQEGNIGLMKAVDLYDYRVGTRFSTYAYWWIRQAISRAITEKERLIRLPVHLDERRKKIARAGRALRGSLGRRPTSSEIARRLRWDSERVEDSLGLVPDALSLDQLLDDDDRSSPIETLEDRQGVSSSVRLERKESLLAIERALQTLTGRESRVIRMRFGLGGYSAHSLNEIGRAVGLSRERVRQIEGAALRKLRACEGLAGMLGSLGAS